MTENGLIGHVQSRTRITQLTLLHFEQLKKTLDGFQVNKEQFYVRCDLLRLAFDMGLDTEIKQLARSSWAPTAFAKQDNFPAIRAGGVIIEDLLHRIIARSYAKKPQAEYTGQELHDLIMRDVIARMATAVPLAYVITIDDDDAKSQRKAQTMAKRAAAKKDKVERYPDGSDVVDGGLQTGEGHPAFQFDLGRLLATRSLRPKLWAYFEKKLKADTALQDMLTINKQLLIFEYKNSGPTFFPSIEFAQAMTNVFSDEDREKYFTDGFAHNHSEGDPSSIFWARIFKKQPITLVSRDSDLILYFAMLKPDQQPVVCEWFTMSDKELIDLPRFVDLCCLTLSLNRYQFALACILCGTDYLDKGVYAKGFGCTSIFHTVRRLRLRGAITGSRDSMMSNFDMDSFLRLLYSEVELMGRKRIKDHMSGLTPLEDTEEPGRRVEEEEPSKKKQRDNKGEAVSVVSASWDNIQADYEKKKLHKIPSPNEIRVVSEAVQWNYAFACV